MNITGIDRIIPETRRHRGPRRLKCGRPSRARIGRIVALGHGCRTLKRVKFSSPLPQPVLWSLNSQAPEKDEGGPMTVEADTRKPKNGEEGNEIKLVRRRGGRKKIKSMG